MNEVQLNLMIIVTLLTCTEPLSPSTASSVRPLNPIGIWSSRAERGRLRREDVIPRRHSTLTAFSNALLLAAEEKDSSMN